MNISREALDAKAIEAGLAALPGWSLAGQSIEREFVFRNFVEAFAFMSGAALCAERMNHHPDWSNSYKTVRVSLSTHEAGGITQYDFELAREMDALAGVA